MPGQQTYVPLTTLLFIHVQVGSAFLGQCQRVFLCFFHSLSLSFSDIYVYTRVRDIHVSVAAKIIC